MQDDSQYYEYDPYNFAQVMRELFFYWFNQEPEKKKNPPEKFAETFLETNRRVVKIRTRIENLYQRQKPSEEYIELAEFGMAFHTWIVDDGLTQSKALSKTYKQCRIAAIKWRDADETRLEDDIIEAAEKAMTLIKKHRPDLDTQ